MFPSSKSLKVSALGLVAVLLCLIALSLNYMNLQHQLSRQKLLINERDSCIIRLSRDITKLTEKNLDLKEKLVILSDYTPSFDMDSILAIGPPIGYNLSVTSHNGWGGTVKPDTITFKKYKSGWLPQPKKQITIFIPN